MGADRVSHPYIIVTLLLFYKRVLQRAKSLDKGAQSDCLDPVPDGFWRQMATPLYGQQKTG